MRSTITALVLVAVAASGPVLESRPGTDPTTGWCHPGFKKSVSAQGFHSCTPCPIGHHTNGGTSPECSPMASTWTQCSHIACRLVGGKSQQENYCSKHTSVNPIKAITGVHSCKILSDGLKPQARKVTPARISVFHHGHEKHGMQHKCIKTPKGSCQCQCQRGFKYPETPTAFVESSISLSAFTAESFTAAAQVAVRKAFASDFKVPLAYVTLGSIKYGSGRRLIEGVAAGVTFKLKIAAAPAAVAALEAKVYALKTSAAAWRDVDSLITKSLAEASIVGVVPIVGGVGAPSVECTAGKGKSTKVWNTAESARAYSSVHRNDRIGTGYARSMLNSVQAWSARVNKAGQWLFISNTARKPIKGLLIQGRGAHSQYVKTFKVIYYGKHLKDASGSTTWTSTSTGNDVSAIMFETPINAAALRIVVQTWNRHISMRVGLLLDDGCQACRSVRDNVPEASRKYSSIWGNSKLSIYHHSQSVLNDPVHMYKHSHCWVPKQSRVGEWMQMDAGTVKTFTGVQLQGRGQKDKHQYVKSFKVQVDGKAVQAATGSWVFFSNSQGFTLSTSMFARPVKGRVLKILPQTFHAAMSMRADVLKQPSTCPVQCNSGWGTKTEPARTPEYTRSYSSFTGRTYSSVWSNDKEGTGHAQSALNSGAAWCAKPSRVGEWMQINLGSMKSVVGVEVQGRANNYQYVKTFKIEVNGQPVKSDTGSYTFVSTTTGQAISSLLFQSPVEAQFIKIYPQTWHGHMSMKADAIIAVGSCWSTKAPTPAPTRAPTRSPTQAPTRSPTQAPTLAPGFYDLKVNNQGARVSTSDSFAPFKTNAIRVQRSGAIKHGWFRVTEIEAFDKNGRKVMPIGARSDNYYGGWRKSSIAPEVYDNSKRWGDNTAIHFQNHATLWFGKGVEIARLQFSQGPNSRYAQSAWKWQKYVGAYVAPTFHTLKTNNQGARVSTSDSFAPFVANAIRVKRTGAIKHGWFRVTEIEAFDKNGKRIMPIGARSDNYYGGWRRSSIAPEVYDNSKRWGDNTAIHFQNYATLWFGKDVEIAKLQLSQGPNSRYAQSAWAWQKFSGTDVYTSKSGR